MEKILNDKIENGKKTIETTNWMDKMERKKNRIEKMVPDTHPPFFRTPTPISFKPGSYIQVDYIWIFSETKQDYKSEFSRKKKYWAPYGRSLENGAIVWFAFFDGRSM